ncbi:hypothetical protein [Paucibacter soli]|uniref:hypothetical protein n=1 Tax=Paucibacter soli TaxID=3133433 RepID=UPI0030A31E42
MTPTDTAKSQAYIGMDPSERATAVGKAVWGYENEQLSMQDLQDILVGKHGHQTALDFIETLSTGVALPGSGKVVSFAGLCAYYQNIEYLAAITSLAPHLTLAPHRAEEVTPLSHSQWIDRLCTRRDNDGDLKIHSLFLHAATRTSATAEKMLSIALQHQPAHPDIEVVLANGGTGGAILAQVLMQRQLGTQLDDSTLPDASTRLPRRNRQM